MGGSRAGDEGREKGLLRAIFIAMALATGIGCGAERLSVDMEPHQVMEEFSMTQTRSGRLAWRLKAKLAIIKEKAHRAKLDEPRIEFFEDGKIVSRVRAVYGVAHLDTHDVILSTSVVLTAIEDGSVLMTERLSYSDKRNLLFTKLPIVLKRPGTLLRGRGFEADPGLNEIRIFNQETVIGAGPSPELLK